MTVVENKQRLAPSILIGCLSELLILRLIKAVGDFLQDPNAVSSFKEKRRNADRQRDYTRELVRKGCAKLDETATLNTGQRDHFRRFNAIVTPIFAAIKLRRIECVHPELEMTLEDLPDAEVIRTHFQVFNPCAKVVLNLIDTFKQSVSPTSNKPPLRSKESVLGFIVCLDSIYSCVVLKVYKLLLFREH